MRRAKKADLLLCAAKDWQNRKCRCNACFELPLNHYICEMVDWTAPGMPWDNCASAALSEVAGMGYDIEDADA